jgi:hypothetical protein
MGGYGSKRWGWCYRRKTTVEVCWSLDAVKLAREGFQPWGGRYRLLVVVAQQGQKRDSHSEDRPAGKGERNARGLSPVLYGDGPGDGQQTGL